MVKTSEFVRQQIEAMKAEIFELGLFRLASAADGLDTGMLPRAWDVVCTLNRKTPHKAPRRDRSGRGECGRASRGARADSY
jgi:hypothetical protein